MKLSPDVEVVLNRAGWYPGRRIAQIVEEWRGKLDAEFRIFPAAEAALLEFGALQINQSGEGAECSREHFVIDPILGLGEGEYFAELGESLGTALYPLGEAFGGHALLAIGEDGRVFAVGGEPELVGPDIASAIQALVEGRTTRAVSPRTE